MVKNPFVNFQQAYPGQKDFDKFYVNHVIHHVYKKIGDTDNYSQFDEVIDEKVDIAKEINSQASECGIEAYLKPFTIAGTTPPDVTVTDDIQDFSEMPEDLAGAVRLGEEAQAAFKSLDPELTGGLDLPNFLASLTPEKFINYVKNKFAPVVPETKSEPVESEKK